MNWLRDKLIGIITVGGIILIAVTDMNVILGTVLIIAAATLVIVTDDASYNSSSGVIRRFSCQKDLTIDDLYYALSQCTFDQWGGVRMGRIKTIPRPVILLENPAFADYFYIYKNRRGNKVYLSTSPLKRFICDYPDTSSGDAQTQPETEPVLDMLYTVARNFAERGIISYEKSEAMVREESAEPPELIAAPANRLQKFREYLEKRGHVGLFRMGLGALLFVIFSGLILVELPDPDAEGWFAAFLIFILLPGAVGCFLWGLHRQIRDWLKK